MDVLSLSDRLGKAAGVGQTEHDSAPVSVRVRVRIRDQNLAHCGKEHSFPNKAEENSIHR